MFNPDYNRKPPTKFDILKGKWSHFWFNYEYTSRQSFGGSNSYTKSLKKQKIINIFLFIIVIYLLFKI